MELASGALQVVLGRLFDCLDKNVSYVTDLKEELAKLEQHQKHVEGLLGDKKNLKDKKIDVNPALIALRHLNYEADDVILDCILRDEYNDRCFWIRHQHRDLRFSLKAGRNLKDINRRVADQIKTLDTFLEVKEKMTTNEGEAEKDEKFASQSYSGDVVIGIDGDIEKIKNWICEENKTKLHCIAVSGMGGLGKTTIARKIYCHADVSKYFEKKIWVSVSKSFNKNEILKSILEAFIGKSGVSQTRKEDYLKEIRNEIEKKKGCLLVMDDVWKFEDVNWWTTLCSTFDVPDKRNCIIVTTRDENVAKQAVRGDNERIHRPRYLSDDESWQLFSVYAFSKDKPEFEGVGRQIVAKCGRLPLAIKTMGAMLATKYKLSEWSEVMNSFHGLDGNPRNDEVIKTLRVSYNELDAHLQLCILSFSIYPEDALISVEQVIHWWIADGLLRKRESKKSMVDLGHEYLSELIGRCLVEVAECRTYDGRVYSCKIHDMLREMIMTIAEEEVFCSFNEKGIMNWKAQDPYWLCLTVDVIKERDNARSESDRILSHEGDDDDNVRDERKKGGGSKSKRLFDENSKIRALLLMIGDHRIDLNKNSGILPSLRMLDLSGGSIRTLDQKSLKNLLDWIGTLTRLACLNLSGLANLEELSSSICELQNLQILVLSGCCNLKKLPEKIGKLKRLIVLDLDKSYNLESLPRSVKNLSNLQELIGAKVTIGGAKSKATFGLPELKSLRGLRMLHIVMSSGIDAQKPDDAKQWNKILSELKNLTTLDLDTGRFKTGSIKLDQLTPPAQLKELYLRNYHRDTLPDWVQPSMLLELQYLCVEEAPSVTKWSTARDEKWRCLEGLRLKDMEKLNADWAEEVKETMPALRYLEVANCYRVKNLPAMKNNIWRR